jgi:hypothetical protein
LKGSACDAPDGDADRVIEAEDSDAVMGAVAGAISTRSPVILKCP